MANPTPEDPKLGEYVETTWHHFRGRVTQIHLGCPESRSWFTGQDNPTLKKSDYDSAWWISVLLHGGGAVTVPIHHAKIVDPFPFSNPWADVYFREPATISEETP